MSKESVKIYMWWSDLIKYLWTKWIIIGPLFVAIATAGGVVSFFEFEGWPLSVVRIAAATAVVIVIMYLAYGFGRFKQFSRTTKAAAAIAKCCHYIRFEPHDAIQYDKPLVNLLARSQWLRNNHPLWPVTRLDADNGQLFLGEGSALILPGLTFSVTKLDGTGTSCHYRVKAEDITHQETRLTPSGFQIRAADRLKDFSVDVIDPNLQEIGRDFEFERFIAGILAALDEK